MEVRLCFGGKFWILNLYLKKRKRPLCVNLLKDLLLKSFWFGQSNLVKNHYCAGIVDLSTVPLIGEIIINRYWEYLTKILRCCIMANNTSQSRKPHTTRHTTSLFNCQVLEKFDIKRFFCNFYRQQNQRNVQMSALHLLKTFWFNSKGVSEGLIPLVFVQRDSTWLR